ncbi:MULTISPECIES: molybdopterin-dependent oxidoreductase [unclassified Roseivivax]|uniref:molybdopterin-dependent oxidoreductase n=1 Tax=unclassified Roseivivax TaxID=2639302 RepID=UPI0020C75CD0|nr:MULTISPECIES: molybdopterin-dependent oxidoreductase [unclassified Roseivivax]
MSPASADQLPEPEGAVLLTVTGDIKVTNVGDTAQFDLDMLRAMEPETFATSTIWTDGVQRYTGVPLRTLMDRLGVESGTIEARAINDYAIDIPLDDPTSSAPIIAFAVDDKRISRREKGPLWIVYPFDSSVEYRSEVVYARSIWQLDRIHVTP